MSQTTPADWPGHEPAAAANTDEPASRVAYV